MLLLLLTPQGSWDGSSAAGFDLNVVASTLVSRLGRASWADLNWLTQDEAFSYFDEAAKRLARITGLFVERDASVTLAENVAAYPNPQNWIDTLHASVSNARLRPASTAELEALDPGWESTAGDSDRYSMDAGPLGTITVYPQPAIPGAVLAQIFHEFPTDISTTQTLAPIPSPIADYFLYFALMRARQKQSEASMPEMAQHFEQRVQMYEQIFTSYWAEGE